MSGREGLGSDGSEFGLNLKRLVGNSTKIQEQRDTGECPGAKIEFLRQRMDTER